MTSNAKTYHKWLGIILVIALMFVTGRLLAAGEQLQRATLNAGGQENRGGDIILRLAVGEAVVGIVGTDQLTLCSGSTCKATRQGGAPSPDMYQLLLPAIQR